MGKQEHEQPGWTWTRRVGSVSYRRFTGLDGGDRPSIFFRFDLPSGQNELPQEIYDILHELKHLHRKAQHREGSQFTGLEFKRDPRHGRVWRLPNDPTGRTAADIIDAKLADLAEKIEREQGPSR
jgi:hypothetical protein